MKMTNTSDDNNTMKNSELNKAQHFYFAVPKNVNFPLKDVCSIRLVKIYTIIKVKIFFRYGSNVHLNVKSTIQIL